MTPEQIRLLRERLGLSEEQLPDDASQEQIDAALRGEAQPPSETPPSENPPAETPPSENPPAETPPAETPAEQTPDAIAAARRTLEAAGLVAVPGDAWQSVQANAAAGARVAHTTEQRRREGIIAEAVRVGRISPAQRPNFTTMFERDPQGTETLLTASVEKGGLMPGTIPIEARGSDPSPESQTAEAYPASWLPELQQDEASRVTVEA